MIAQHFICHDSACRRRLLMLSMAARSLLPSILFFAAIGCGSSRPSALIPPAVNPAAVVEAVFNRGDMDTDGLLSAAERSSAPAIDAIAAELDEDGDESVSRAELLGWLERVKESRVALASLSVVILRRGRPVSNAKVRLIPDPAMGGAIQGAEGTTDRTGTAVMSAGGTGTPGVNCGLYAISVTFAGQASIDASKSAGLGIAVGAGLPVGYQTVIDLR